MRPNRLRFTLAWVPAIVLAGLLAACGRARSEPTRLPAALLPARTGTPTVSRVAPAASLTSSPTISPTPATPTARPTPSQTPTPPPALWLAPYLPTRLRQAAASLPGVAIAAQPENASLRFELAEQKPLARWIYALVAPFPTLADGITATDLQDIWQGKASGPWADKPLYLAEDTLLLFSSGWGPPNSPAVQALPPDQVLDRAWADSAWAIIPFERIEPRWKVLELDGQSPLRKDFDPQAYSLSLPFALTGEEALVDSLRPAWAAMPATNRDPAKLTTVLVTGVTAMVRGTAWKMEQKGILYPAEEIRGWLREADILHISNEIPFDPDCPRPDPRYSGLIFCSDPRYIALLEDIGADVIELTGDHFADYGAEATLFTIDLYRQAGWPYYGGGANAEEARQPVLFEHNGNKIAFLGCNAKGGGYATASDTVPGAWECDFDYMRQEVQRLRAEGYLPIVTFQHQESENSELYRVRAEYRPDFQGMAEAGAVIVSGSQAHQPLNFEFVGDGLVHYGLGNLFFDQYRYYAPATITDRAFLDRHVFYDGRYLGVELLTIQFVDLARSRPATAEERLDLLQVVFKGSGW